MAVIVLHCGKKSKSCILRRPSYVNVPRGEETANRDQQCFAASLMVSLQSNLPKVS